MKKFLWLFLILLVSCSQSIKEEEQEQEALLRINFQDGDLPSTHPHIGIDYRMRSLQSALFEGLTRMNPEGIPQPAAAKKIEVSPDGKHYTFYLRPSLWSNGKKVSAYDFETAWKKAIAKGSPCRRPDLFYLIKNAEKIKKGEVALEDAGIRAENEEILHVEIEHPAPYFLELISNPIFSPLADESEEPAVFNGSFLIDQWKHDEYILLKKNPAYWDSGTVSLDKIEIFFITDPLTAVQLYDKGELDWIGSPFSCFPNEVVFGLKSKNVLQTKEVARIFWLYCNTEAFPFNNPSMRKALSLAIDRDSIMEHVLPYQAAALAPLPKSLSLLAQESLPPNAQLEESKKLLDKGLEELGYTLETLPPITLSHSHITGQRQLAEIIQSQWEKNLGIKVHLAGSEWNHYFSDLTKGNFQVGGCLKSALYRDPTYHLELLEEKGNSYNVSRWEDPNFRARLQEAREAVDLTVRNQLLREAEAILVDQTPVIPLYSEVYLYMIRPHIEGVVIHDLGHVDFKWIKNQFKIK